MILRRGEFSFTNLSSFRKESKDAAVSLARCLQSGRQVLSMRIRYHARALVAVALLAAGTALSGAETKSPAAVRTVAGTSVQKLMEQASSQRERMIAEHEALAKQLREATEEQRKAILDKMQEQKKAFEAAQSALHKQIREEQRRQRQSAAPRR
jgi:hypothetical protein